MSKLRATFDPGPVPQVQKPDPRKQIAHDAGKPVVNWEPRSNSDIAVELESCIIFGVPEYMEQITDAQAKILHAMLAEILDLRDKVAFLTGKIAVDQTTAHALAMKDAAQIASLNVQANAAAGEKVQEAKEEE